MQTKSLCMVTKKKQNETKNTRAGKKEWKTAANKAIETNDTETENRTVATC